MADTNPNARFETFCDGVAKSLGLVRDSYRNGYVAFGVYALLALLAVWFPLTIAVVTTILWTYWLTFSLRSE